MTRHTPANQPAFRPTATATTPAVATAALHHVQNAATAELIAYTPAQLAAKQRQDAILYARWLARRNAQAERDRKNRRFLIGLGAAVGLALVAAVAALIWLIVHTLAAIGLPLIALAVAALLALGAVAGHRCITVVQHWH